MFRLTAVALSLACLTAFATQATAGEKHVAVGFATYDAHHPTPVVEVRHGHYGHGVITTATIRATAFTIRPRSSFAGRSSSRRRARITHPIRSIVRTRRQLLLQRPGCVDRHRLLACCRPLPSGAGWARAMDQ